MTIELIEISVSDRQPHPRLADRITGHVRAVLAETTDGREQRHALSIPVWADAAPGASASDIDMALMLKAVDIVARLKLQLGS
jgi:hypothetical protein